MPDTRICSICGKPYIYNGILTTCNLCYEKDEEIFGKIREYLEISPGAKIFDVSNHLKISVGQIKRYLREGRLEIIEKQNSFLTCEKCGISIQSGKLCDNCLLNPNSKTTNIHSNKDIQKQKGIDQDRENSHDDIRFSTRKK